MRVLYILPNLSKGGAERMALDICHQLSITPGVEVKMVLLEESIQYDVSKYNFEITLIPASITLSPIRGNEIKVEALQSYINQYQPSHINTALFISEIVSRSVYYPHARWFTHCQDNMVQFRNLGFETILNKNLLTNYLEKRYLLKRYDANGGNTFITISQHTDDYFKSVLPPHKYTQYLLPNAADCERFINPHTRIVNDGSKPLTLVTVGSFVPKKNQRFLLDVIKIIKDKGIKVQLNILGDGPSRPLLEQGVLDLKLSDNVRLHGNVERVEQYLWEADIYTHAAYYEPFGIVFIEAMAAGLPVVTLDGLGNRDIIEEGYNGYMVMEQNAELYAQKILLLYQDKQLYQTMSEQAIIFSKRYHIKENVEQLIKIYNQ